MSGLTELHLSPAVAGALEALGYTAQDGAVRDQVATAARGHNLALAWPPAARYSVPALAGLVSAQQSSKSRVVILAPADSLGEWAAAVTPFASAAGLSLLLADTPSRAARRLKEGTLDILITSPATAGALQERSALKMDAVGHVVLAWPEQFEGEDPLTGIMQDLPAEAQRVVVMAVPQAAHPVVERYARRAHLTGPMIVAEGAVPPARPAVRVVTTPWSQRAAALNGLLSVEDPASVSVWCADAASVAEARAALPLGDNSVEVTSSEPKKAAVIVAWDLPAPDKLNMLRALGDLVLIAPAHAASYLRLVTSKQSAVRVPGVLETLRSDAARRRAQVISEIEKGELDGAVSALAPLFERHDPVLVSAALLRLWQTAAQTPVAAAVEEGTPGVSPVARVWIGAGKKDSATPADIVAVLNREVGVPTAKIGRIEIREVFCLVEVPTTDAEEIARKLNGKMVRRRKLIAKVDRGPIAARERR
jgi:hypothetical protein